MILYKSRDSKRDISFIQKEKKEFLELLNPIEKIEFLLDDNFIKK